MEINIDKKIYDSYSQHHISLENTLLDLLSVANKEFCTKMNLSFIQLTFQSTVTIDFSDSLASLLFKNFPDETSHEKIINILAGVGLMFGGNIL